jgi:hypothetical protein
MSLVFRKTSIRAVSHPNVKAFAKIGQAVAAYILAQQ